jgi:hypothetical protein
MKDNLLKELMRYSLIGICSFLTFGCGGGGGESSSPVVQLASAPVSGNTTPAPTITSFEVTGVTEINESITLNWTTENSTSCTAVNDWSGSKPTSGSHDVYVTEEKVHTFTLNCSGNGTVSRSLSVRIDDPQTEGTCRNPHTAEFDREFMGDFEIPAPYSVLPNESIKSVGLKDYGARWIFNNYKQFTNESWVNNCTLEEYTRLQYRLTLRRLKDHGAEHVTVYNYAYWEDASAPKWTIAQESKHYTNSEIEYIVETATDLGMKVHLTWQMLPVDKNKVWLFPFDGSLHVDMRLLEKLMDGHEENILREAKWAQEVGIDSISADWSAMWLCMCGLNGEYGHDHAERERMKDYYMSRMSSIIDGIREVFRGDIYVGDGVIWNDRRVIDKVDYVYLGLGRLLTEGENKHPTVELVTERVQDHLEKLYYNWYCLDGQECPQYASQRNVPWVVQLFVQSTRDFLHSGWIEDGFCTDGQPGDLGGATNLGQDRCVQHEVPIDFSVQAIGIEGMMRGVYLQTAWTNIKGTTTSTAYWLSDTLQPDPNQTRDRTVEGFPNISQSIRGKPAEKILKYWYTGEFEHYDPKFID